MSVRERLDDALFLWKHGRKSGAWIQVLIAAAPTSGKRFPKQSDSAAFRSFIREVTRSVITGAFAANPLRTHLGNCRLSHHLPRTIPEPIDS